jgi:hypothetical protein
MIKFQGKGERGGRRRASVQNNFAMALCRHNWHEMNCIFSLEEQIHW